jgi:hypothetical protein
MPEYKVIERGCDGDGRVYVEGDVVELEEDKARGLVKRGIVELVKGVKAAKREKAEIKINSAMERSGE